MIIPRPPIVEQQAISAILGALDDKIELNCKMNKTLEEMAQAIFKSWFIDFDPVRYKAAGQHPPGLAPNIADLFPDGLEESSLGHLPKGWKCTKLNEVCELSYGKALKASDRKPGNIAVMGSNGQIGWHNKPLVNGPGVVVGRKGNPGVVTWVNQDFFPIDTTFYVVPKNGVSLVYLYYMLKHLNLLTLSADSAVPGLNRNIAYMCEVLVPDKAILTIFDNQVMLLFQNIHMRELQNQCLEKIRDTLLPKLISGELRVPDAERIVERAL